MRHQKRGRKFGRERKLRRGLMRSLLNNFFVKGKIKTTEAKAKEIRPLIEKMITRAKKDTVANRRLLGKSLREQQLKKIFTDFGPKYRERRGGYTRIIKLGRLPGGDASPMAIIELVQ